MDDQWSYNMVMDHPIKTYRGKKCLQIYPKYIDWSELLWGVQIYWIYISQLYIKYIVGEVHMLHICHKYIPNISAD